MASTALNSSFYAYRLLYQKRCDEASNMSYVTTKQRVLLSQYQAKQADELTTLKTTAFYLGVIRGARKRIKEIKRLVNENTPLDEANRLYAEAVMLQETIKQASGAIDAN